MNFLEAYQTNEIILMEGAIGERMKREYQCDPDQHVALASYIYHENARMALKELYGQYHRIAEIYHLPMLITTPTRRANKENIAKSRYNSNIIRENVLFLKEIKEESHASLYIGGLMGCRGDAYNVTSVLSVNEAHEFHSWQAEAFREEKVDYLIAGIMPAISEALGMAKAMEDAELPYIISFMIRENGRLIDGTTIHDAISSIDQATTRKPVCYITNCVHPTVLNKALSQQFNQTETVRERFHGIQANTSPLSPEELDHCHDLQTSEPDSLAEEMVKLRKEFGLKIFGGCCGTDQTHIEEMARRISLF